ncbi:MAG: hypothetical protein JWP94_2868 [Mucilaginibacter sp.]|nr:hypothetical protein [Mucilaginibacter sp.]
MNILGPYVSITEAAGVSVHIQPGDGNTMISACSVAVHQNKLTIVKKLTDVHSIEELGKHFHVKQAVALNLTGKGIIQKKIEKTIQIDQSNFSSVLPNAVIDDFYVQNFISGEHSFISVIRRADADRWINHLQKQGLEPMMLSLGAFPVQHILSQINVYGNELIFNGHTIILDEESHWSDYKFKESAVSPFPLKVELESIHEKLLLPYAAAFQMVLADKIDPVRAAVLSVDSALHKTVKKNKLKAQGFLILCLAFVLLLINFLLLSWLNSSNGQLTEQVSRSVQSTDDMHKISDQLQQKERLLKTLGWDGDINKGGLMDQVAALLPADITWNEVAIDPFDLSATRVRKSIVFFNRRIRIAGNSEKIIPVNEWIARIKTKRWVKNAQLDSYTFSSELNTGQFVVLIDY